jgi:hypothetical protein
MRTAIGTLRDPKVSELFAGLLPPPRRHALSAVRVGEENGSSEFGRPVLHEMVRHAIPTFPTISPEKVSGSVPLV